MIFFKNNSRSYHYTGVSHWRKNIVAVIIQDRVIDDNLKRQIKNQTLFTLYTVDYSYQPEFFNILAIGQKYLSIYPPTFFNIHRVIIFPIFYLDNRFFSCLCRFIYKLDQHFFIYHSWYTSNFETTYKKPPFIKVAIFSSVVLVSNYHGCKGEAIKLISYFMMDIIYKTVRPSHLKKLQIIKKYKKLMFQVNFIIVIEF